MPLAARPQARPAAARAAGGFPSIQGYRFLRKLGEGGMGAVYLAEDVTLGRRVAIKVVSARLAQDGAARTRLLREARAMATAEHPHIVRVYSFGEHAGVVYIVMEYVDGDDLGERLRRLGRLPIEEALQVTRQIAEALEAASEKGIVHRDIKPANVLLDARDHVRVADFGLAKPVASSAGETPLTQTGLIVGTPHYLSPEQARGEAVDFRSDIYSLGVLLYEMLAGTPPFHGTTPVAVVAQHLNTPPPPLRDVRAETPSGVVRLVEHMMEKEPGRRPQSYAALRKAIEESTAAPARWTSGSPYRGLAPFDFEHAPIFFGRARAVAGVIEALRAQAASGRAFVLVLGMSGSGKSSLLRAGVLPCLLQPGAIEGVRLWRRAVLRPADAAGDLFDGLAAALMRPEALPELGADGTTDRELARLLRESPRGAGLLVKGGVSQAAAELRRAQGLAEQPDLRLVLVVDQMEEMFTLERIAAAQRAAFFETLSSMARSGHVWVLATLRSDFYARCEELGELMALKEGAGQYHLLPPTPAEVAQMIRHPARAAGLRFEEDAATQVGLDEVLRDAAADQVGNLPLLEFALEELYRRRSAEGMLTHAAYREIGGVEGALTRRAEAAFTSLSPDVQATLADVLGALVRVGSGEEETFNRRYASLDSFVSPDSLALVEAFVDSRLFVADRGDEGRAVVSIAHEALLRSWPRLRQWLEENRELLRVRGRVAAAAALWAEKGKPADLLLAEGKPFEEAAPLLGVRGLDLSADEREFLRASEARDRRRRRARRLMNVNSVVLLIGAAAVYSFWLWKVVPTFAALSAGLGKALPLSTRLAIMTANATVRLSPLLVVAVLLLYRFRKRLRLPEFVGSGLALAIATGVGLLLTLCVFVILMFQVAVDMPPIVGPPVLAAPSRAAVALEGGDYAGSVHQLRLFREWLHESARGGGTYQTVTAPSATVLLADAYLALGDDERAQERYEEALRHSRTAGSFATARESEAFASLVRSRLSALAADVPRLGLRCLDAVEAGGALVAGVNRGGPAFRAGLRPGDVIRRIDGTTVGDRSGLVAELRRRSVGQEVRLGVSREGRPLDLSLRLGRAVEVFAIGCGRGYAEDCASLGTVYERGEGVAVDLPRAAELYRRACEGAEPSGCVGLALIYESGRGVARDAARAATLLRQSCDAGDVWGCNNLGVLQATGTGATKDESQAGERFRTACAAGLPEACANQRFWTSRVAPERDPNAPFVGGPFLGGTSRPYTR
jgi:TPR repeat protein/predicted Ser/Thr protein kinase